MLPVALQSRAALEALKEAAKSAPALWTGVAIALTAVANVPGMSDAKANWNALAKVLEVEYPGILGNAAFVSRGDWIADDQRAFLDATSHFGGDLQKLSGLCYTMEGQVDQVRDAYQLYWQEIGALAATVVGYIAAAKLMLLMPQSRVAGEIWLQRLVAFTNLIIANKTKILLGFLGAAGVTLSNTTQSMTQMFNIKPTGRGAIDFKRATISTAPPSQWIAPKREIPEPAPPPTPTPTSPAPTSPAPTSPAPTSPAPQRPPAP
ncbi:hypothetical protein [Microtetraspora sp. NBRC 16547]|uniref:hypothetical protein n=1 Tax=Microtetraspora sp. NBRC 16547 TaxID=3030993 RepID=UPI0024A3B6DE|nr:hypothetical protein [Microtetraspora sp. NBRC 16547]GLX00590.1 hypothetical protein Misp02_46760 [Microtetraspora sp. NBRC 16547]